MGTITGLMHVDISLTGPRAVLRPVPSLTLQDISAPAPRSQDLLKRHISFPKLPVLWQSEGLGCCSVSLGLGERWILASKVKVILVNSKVQAKDDHGCDILMSQLPQLYCLNFLFEQHS